MNLEKWNEIYLNNKRLDKIFYEKYKNDNELYRKNVIELLVELGEFVNETKIFKYWTIKEPEKNKVLEEYADVITMSLTFMSEFNLELDNQYLHIESNDKLELINYLYSKITLLMKKENVIKDIFGNLLYLGELLNFNEEEILEAIETKHKIIKERLESDY